MFSVQQILTLFLTLTMELGLTACGAEAVVQPAPETSEPPAQVQETPEATPDTPPESSELELKVAEGTESYRDFQMNNVLHAPEGEIHYHIYIPDSYDGSESYALFLTLPGYEGLYFQGVGQNLYSENFAFEALNYNDRMIVAAPQLSDWGETSAVQTIALTEYLLDRYNIDRERVYAEGYSGGGETLSRVMGMRPDLFTAYLQCSSQWDGAYEPVAEARVPVYFVIGEGDEYYSAEPSWEAYNRLHDLYTEAGLTEEDQPAAGAGRQGCGLLPRRRCPQPARRRKSICRRLRDHGLAVLPRMRDAGTFPRRPAGRGAVGEKWAADLTLGAVLLFLMSVS